MRLIGNLLSLTGAELVSKAATFLAFARIARLAMPAGMGQIEFAASVTLCAALIVDQGFGAYGAREIARDPRRTRSLTTEIILLRFLLAIVAFLLVTGLAWALCQERTRAILITAYGSSLLGMPLLLAWVFQGREWMALAGGVQMVRQLVFAGFILAFFRSPDQLFLVAAAEVLGVAAAAIFSVVMFSRRVGTLLPPWSVPAVSTIRVGATIGLSQVFWSAKLYGSTVVVAFLAGRADQDDDVGLYGGAMRIMIALHAFVWLYYFNLVPSFARLWHENRVEFHRLIETSTRVVSWLALGGGLLAVLLATPVITVAFGNAFHAGGDVLGGLTLVCVIAALSGHCRFGLIATGHQTAEMIAAGLGVAVMVPLVWAGYRYGGVVGAGIGLAVVEVAVWAAAWSFARRSLGTRGQIRAFGVPLAVVGGMTGLCLILVPWGLGLAATAGFLGTVGGAWATDPRFRLFLSDSVRRLVVAPTVAENQQNV